MNDLLTSEMTQEEWSEFRRQWIDDYAQSMAIECDCDAEEAKDLAEIRFEDYVGQEGFTGRNERICAQRDAEKYFL